MPKALVDKFNDWLGREAVDTNRHGEYRKWLRYYLDFCHKYGHGYLDKKSLGLKEVRCLLFAQITPPNMLDCRSSRDASKRSVTMNEFQADFKPLSPSLTGL